MGEMTPQKAVLFEEGCLTNRGRSRVGRQLGPEVLHDASVQRLLVVHELRSLKLVFEQLHRQTLCTRQSEHMSEK